MRFRAAFVILLLLSCASAASAGEQPWTEVRSPHFRVLTDAGAGDARKVAHETSACVITSKAFVSWFTTGQLQMQPTPAMSPKSKYAMTFPDR